MFHTHNMFNFFKNRELNELYLTVSIKSFAIALIGIFIPIYLYQLEYSFQSIFLFYISISTVHLALTIPAAKISAKFGVKHTILFSMPFLIFFFLLLYSLEQFKWPIVLIGAFYGVYTSLFWIGYHTDFSKFSNRKKRGRQVGFITILSSLFYSIGPITGGIILTFFSFKILFILVSFLLLSSVIPLFFSKELHEPMRFNLKGFIKKDFFKNFVSYAGKGIEQGLSATVWPLFIFIFILSEKYISLGLVSSLTFFSSMIFIMIIGKYSDQYRKKILKIGSLTTSLIWILRSFVVTPIQVFIIDTFYGFSKNSMDISFDAVCYDKANKEGILKTIILREMSHHVGKIMLFILLLFVTDFVQIFRFGGSISSLLHLFF